MKNSILTFLYAKVVSLFLSHYLVQKNNLEKAFEAFKNRSSYSIPLYELNNGDFFKEMALKSAYEALYFQLKLKEPAH